MISEFTQYDIGEEEMDEMLDHLDEDSRLYYKLKDIRLLYEGFQDYLRERYITKEELLDVLKFAGAVHAMRRAGYLDVKGKLYPGMRHEILNEKGKEKVWHDVFVYMKKKGF